MDGSNNIQTQNPWWKSSKSTAHDHLKGHIEYLSTRYNYRTEKNLRSLRLYGQSELLGLNEDFISVLKTTDRVRINIVRQIVEAIQAKVARHKPKARFLSEDGNSLKQAMAKKTEKYCTGVAHNDDHWEKSSTDFLHACVFGTCARKFFIGEKGNPESELVLIENIKIDESEVAVSSGGKPLALYQEEFINIDRLKDKYPKLKNQFVPSNGIQNGFFSGYEMRDMVKVTEAWKLPSSIDAKDGRHVICTDNLTLLDEPWEQEYFPFEFYTFAPNILGFFGQGIPERLMLIQLEINKLLKDIHDIIHLGCVPKIFAQTGSIVKNHFNNALGTVVEFMGTTAPQMAQLMSVPPELFVQLERLIQFAFEEVGLSSLSAHSQKPKGLDSGKALREFVDIESDRFSIISERWQDFHMRCFKRYLKTAEMAAEEFPELEAKALDDNGFEIISLKDLNMDELDFVIRAYPVNMLSDRPAGRLADIRDLLDTGMIQPEEGKALLDFPDIKKYMSNTLAPRRFLELIIDTMIEKGSYTPPDQFTDLELGIQLFTNSINRYRQMDSPPENLFLLEQWVSDATNILTVNQEEMMEEEMAKIQLQQGDMNGEQQSAGSTDQLGGFAL